MIDTDKYEGHTPAPWRWVDPSTLEGKETICELIQGIGEANAQLIADAPLLLAEVKRLREKITQLCGYFDHTILEADGFMELMYELGMFEEDDEE